MIKVKRALLSVSDKSGLVEFARGLHVLGVEIVSTGGTARTLKNAQIPVVEVSDYTGYPEILDGRVKTLNPVIHGGLLAVRDNPQHMDQLGQQKIGLIDLVVVNLYPFEKVIQKKNVSLDEALENIDVGGPTMLRAAAKNFKSVAVVCNPVRYREVLDELQRNNGLLSEAVLKSLAVEVFRNTSQYDEVIYDFLNQRMRSGELSGLPRSLTLRFNKVGDLRYGENPHQDAAFYQSARESAGLALLQQLHGKELSFNNYLDLHMAVQVVKDFSSPAAVVIKHNNPSGVAEDAHLSAAYKKAWKCDTLSAFGGIIGLNKKVDAQTAGLISKSGFMECVVAPDYAREALKILTQKKNVRLIKLKWSDLEKNPWDFRQVDGGLLVQTKDEKNLTAAQVNVVSLRKPTKVQLASMLFGWKVIRHVKSNAIILVKGHRTVGIGCGQTSRVESVHLAIRKAGANARGSCLVSDAFIPKTDNIEAAARAGIKAIIQTGGSIADEEVIAAANKHNIAMVMTGIRHFKH
ncbi:MAG: bifunctional phosphoribosylaminoimidazolecarboxamide formyltransferase/IMP cyclohydrolase [Candidatus Omnitrophota bacterium]|jgi:phosphoribosylaminoimidazolecarboxamide formyltransferase/IMP cyclohydrolase